MNKESKIPKSDKCNMIITPIKHELNIILVL